MNFSAAVTLLSLFFVCISSPVLAADDIFATPAPTPTMVQRYPTAERFLSATKSGEIPRLLRQHPSGYNGRVFGPAIINILIKEFGLDARYYKDAVRASVCIKMISDFTDYDFDPQDQQPIIDLRNNQQEIPVDLRDIFNKFALQYDNAVKEYVAKFPQSENQVAEARRNHDIDTDRAKQVRKQKLAEVIASPAYKQWEAALQVQQGEELISNARRVLNDEDAVQRESGVTDLAARRAAGVQIVAGKRLVEAAFDTYKKQGGKAITPSEVVAGPDPAADYR